MANGEDSIGVEAVNIQKILDPVNFVAGKNKMFIPERDPSFKSGKIPSTTQGVISKEVERQKGSGCTKLD